MPRVKIMPRDRKIEKSSDNPSLDLPRQFSLMVGSRKRRSKLEGDIGVQISFCMTQQLVRFYC